MPSSQLQTTHPRDHLLLACNGHSQNAAKWPYSISAGLTPCLVYMPGLCCSLPLHLPSQDLGSLLRAVGAAELLVPAHGARLPGTHWLWCWPEAAVSLWVMETELGLKTEEWFASCARQLSPLCKTKGCPVTPVALPGPLAFHPLPRGRARAIESALKVDCGGTSRCLAIL